MRHGFALLLVAAAGCGGGNAPAATTPPPIGTQPEARPQRLAAPTAHDPTAACPALSTIHLELFYDADCAGPASLAFEHDPSKDPSLVVWKKAPDHVGAELRDVNFGWNGCIIDATWVDGPDKIVVAAHATGPTTMGGTATSGACAAQVTGSIVVWN